MPEFNWWYPEEPGEEPFLHGLYKSNVNVMLDDDPLPAAPGPAPILAELLFVRFTPYRTIPMSPAHANR